MYAHVYNWFIDVYTFYRQMLGGLLEGEARSDKMLPGSAEAHEPIDGQYPS